MGKKKYKHTSEEKKKIASLGLKTVQVMPEAEMREKLLNMAVNFGIEHEIRTILERYEKLMALENDPKNRESLGIMGLAEIHKYIGFSDNLVVNHKEVVPSKNDDRKIILTGNE